MDCCRQVVDVAVDDSQAMSPAAAITGSCPGLGEGLGEGVGDGLIEGLGEGDGHFLAGRQFGLREGWAKEVVP